MEFLYPTSRQFPFDEACERIVRALEERNWSVPGITITFDEYGSGGQKFRKVDRISGENFRLWFCRVQRLMEGGRYNDTAAVMELVIPQKELHVYDDESGPTLYAYSGRNWEKDREKFLNRMKVSSKLNKEPRTYLMYKGSESTRDRYTHTGRRPRYLVHDNDLEREYDPKFLRDAKHYHTDSVMEDFDWYLTEVVLKEILSHPVPTEKIPFTPEAAIPLPDSIGPIFCFGEYRDDDRIKRGKAGDEDLHPADRFGMSGSGYRLMSLSTRNDGTVPEVAYDGFLWCGIGEVMPETPIKSLNVPGHYRWSDREKFVIRLKPERANGIYIAEHAEYERRRNELANQSKDSDIFTDDEVADFVRARARTIVPITEYKGGFEQPVVLINRELSLDEVEVVSGPHETRRY